MSPTAGPILAGMPTIGRPIDTSDLLPTLRESGCTICLIGIFHEKKPQPDNLQHVEGLSKTELSRCLGALPRSALWQSVMAEGVARCDPSASQSLGMKGFVLALALGRGYPAEYRWGLILTRPHGHFSQTQCQRLVVKLRQAQNAFEQPSDEKGLGRLLLGHDHRLLAADLHSQDSLLQNAEAHERVTSTVMPVVYQRWPALPIAQPVNLIANLDGQRTWVCLGKHNAGGLPDGESWVCETRPLHDNELPAVGLLDDPRIVQALAYLHDNLQHAPRLADIAKHTHCSPFHFHRLFSQAVGLSPKHYQQQLQMLIARWLLRNSHLPINEVAAASGFASHGHFTSTFRKHVGKSPREFRESKNP
ncbi:MAG: helix-turn-helix domain-containing protein [Phycisphaera sp.]|nr:helix-turn-helix domain-containing protein [Phycisphaera sp.]